MGFVLPDMLYPCPDLLPNNIIWGSFATHLLDEGIQGMNQLAVLPKQLSDVSC